MRLAVSLLNLEMPSFRGPLLIFGSGTDDG